MNKPGVGVELVGSAERLPFQVRVAQRSELEEVVRLRSQAYGRHLPEFGAKLSQPEAADYQLGCEVFVAISKLDGSLLGTLRTHANALQSLPLEGSIQLPDRFTGKRMIEATRLSVLGNANSSLVRNALFKAFFSYAREQNADWMLVTGRKPIDRMYEALLYRDVAEEGAFFPMKCTGNLPHRVMCMAVKEAEPIWREARHPLYDFAFVTRHPDIDVSGARDLGDVWERRPGAKLALFQPPVRSLARVAV
ncbi:hypothetical protein [Pelomonas sp. SE-A7]|uniref:N-acyl amino acid synthase FeeM domain-containing protein n=1 Tax=Pelomonas sp. SE-A7 TaxID=3054953 RepID=UPI00259C88F7|nr:hypothetical protein [Pelomonas sp. SE-A7]MDM4766288.1 hypothetical protein [Pelomonas sp. SE-A7]